MSSDDLKEKSTKAATKDESLALSESLSELSLHEKRRTFTSSNINNEQCFAGTSGENELGVQLKVSKSLKCLASTSSTIAFAEDTTAAASTAALVLNDKTELFLLAYNVYGLQNKENYIDFYKYINSFPIIMLFETFVMAKDFGKFERYFGDYTLKWIAAERPGLRGRAKGGVLIGFRNNIEGIKCKFTDSADPLSIVIELDNQEYYLVPTYLSCTNWNNDFKKLKNLLAQINKNRNVMIIGDLNARIGEKELSQKTMNKRRKSKDRILNNAGKKIIVLAEEYKLQVLNGVYTGDQEGEFTFLGPKNAHSVIDLCLVGEAWLSLILDFAVDAKPYSDHLPIIVTIAINRTKNILQSSLVPEDDQKNYRRQSDECVEIHCCTLEWLDTFRKDNTITSKAKYLDYKREYKNKCAGNKAVQTSQRIKIKPEPHTNYPGIQQLNSTFKNIEDELSKDFEELIRKSDNIHLSEPSCVIATRDTQINASQVKEELTRHKDNIPKP